MKRALVVTTIHQADDPRIRERTIPSLAREFEVTYAAKAPGPSRRDGIEFVELRGARIRRWFSAARLMSSRRFAVVSVHDPELIPAALAWRAIGRRSVIDVHEDVPAQIRHKSWVARPLRIPIAWFSHWLLRLASRFLSVTLAEDGYQRLFRRTHVVFPNYAPAGAMPDLDDDAGYVIYVGDVTIERGALDMVGAVADLDRSFELVIVGRCPDDLRALIEQQGAEVGVNVTLTGNLPHHEAMERARSASVGLSLLRSQPNEANSMPTKVIEYLQMGIPVVATDLPGTRDALSGRKGVWLVAPSDSHAARSAVLEAARPEVRRITQDQARSVRGELVWPDEPVRRHYLSVARPD